MEVDTKLIIISKSKFCFVPELHSGRRILNKLNSFSEQLRYEIINQTNLSELATERLNQGMLLGEKIENEIWNAILEGIEESQINVLDLGSTKRIELFTQQLLKEENKFQLNCINLELSETEFVRRCNHALKKGKELSAELVLSFSKKCHTQEMQRQKEIAKINSKGGIQFVKYDAENYEKNIISKQVNSIR